MNILTYREGGRGTGRTTRLAKALPAHSLYIVPNDNTVRVVDDYFVQIGRKGEVDVRSGINRDQFRGIRGKYKVAAIDHTCFENLGVDGNMIYSMLAPSVDYIMTNDYQGDVITTSMNISTNYQKQVPLVEPLLNNKFKSLFGRFWPL